MNENDKLLNLIKHDLLIGIWTDDSIKAFNVVEKKLKELESLHQAYNELDQTNKELLKINEQLGKEKEELEEAMNCAIALIGRLLAVIRVIADYMGVVQEADFDTYLTSQYSQEEIDEFMEVLSYEKTSCKNN